MSDAALPNPIPPLDASPEIKEVVERLTNWEVWEESRATAKVLLDAAALLRRLGEREAIPAFDLRAHLQRQREWSARTFGPGTRTAGVVDHIRKELREIEADPLDVAEWIDVVVLALDGAWRAGFSPEAIIVASVAKQTKNEGREWPDWRTASPNKAIEHVRVAALAAGKEGE